MIAAKRTRRNGSDGNKGNKRHGDYENTRIREYENTRSGGDRRRLYNGRNDDRRIAMTASRWADVTFDARNPSNPSLDTRNTWFIHRASCGYAVASCLSDCSGSRRSHKHALSQAVRNPCTSYPKTSVSPLRPMCLDLTCLRRCSARTYARESQIRH